MCNKKVCKTCNLEKIKEDFIFHSASGYYLNECKSCMNEKRRDKRRIELGDKYDHTKAKIPHKICDDCKQLKKLDLNNFPKSGRAYSNTCRVCSGTKRDLKQRRLEEEYRGQTKICTSCSEEKEIVENFYFRTCNNRFYPRCIKCEQSNGKNYNNLPSTILLRYQNADKKKNFICNLTLEFIVKNTNVSCTYCGYPSTGLDRIDNNLGHTMENCVPCCKECNIARNDIFSHEEMFELGETIKRIKDKRNA